jgi:hypothetical protein
MEWIYIAVIAGSIATSGYPNEEACQGHKVVFDRDHKTNGVCVQMPQLSSGILTFSSSVPNSSVLNMMCIIGGVWKPC